MFHQLQRTRLETYFVQLCTFVLYFILMIISLSCLLFHFIFNVTTFLAIWNQIHNIVYLLNCLLSRIISSFDVIESSFTQQTFFLFLGTKLRKWACVTFTVHRLSTWKKEYDLNWQVGGYKNTHKRCLLCNTLCVCLSEWAKTIKWEIIMFSMCTLLYMLLISLW